jgi:predicted Kef-type K+ transport protein
VKPLTLTLTGIHFYYVIHGLSDFLRNLFPYALQIQAHSGSRIFFRVSFSFLAVGRRI